MVMLFDAAVSMKHPYNARENAALESFGSQQVDLSAEAMTLGRGLRDVVIGQCETLSGSHGFPLLLAGQSFLAGSFGRRTQAQPLDDIDLYIVMNAGGLKVWDARYQVWWNLEGQTPGPLSCDPGLRLNDWVSADLVLERVAAGLRRLPFVKEYELSVGINTKRKSAYIKIGRINVDLSPVVLAKFSNAIDRYYMPAGQGSWGWKPTNPKDDHRRLSVQNQEQGGLLLPTVRMMKSWNENRNAGRLKGILLETIVAEGLASNSLVGLAQSLHLAFVHLQLSLGKPPCLDPTGLGPALDVNLSADDRTASI